MKRRSRTSHPPKSSPWPSRSKSRTGESTRSTPASSARLPRGRRQARCDGPEEDGHRHRLIELFQRKFGQEIPLIRRQDVRGRAAALPALPLPLSPQEIRSAWIRWKRKPIASTRRRWASHRRGPAAAAGRPRRGGTAARGRPPSWPRKTSREEREAEAPRCGGCSSCRSCSRAWPA